MRKQRTISKLVRSAKGGRKIVCLGFSANPPHLGHQEIARIVLQKKLADEVWLIPCLQHAFDKELASSRHRWEMSKLLKAPGIKIIDIELRRKGKSYTIDTVRKLKAKYPGYDFSWALGSDIVKTKEYTRWKDWKKLSRWINFLVVKRPGYVIGNLPRGFVLAGVASKKISSTQIRKRLAGSRSIGGLVSPRVKKYIEKHKLYR